MYSGFPTNTIVLILAMMISTGAGTWFILSEGFRRVIRPARTRRYLQWGVAIALVAWLVIRLAFAVSPSEGEAQTIQTNVMNTMLGMGLLAGSLPLLISPRYRQIIRAIPETWLVGLHATRMGGFLFLALLDMKLLPPQFALPAGYGDISVGLLALGMVYALAHKKPYARALVTGWNLLGLLDFVIALGTGLIYLGPFGAQVAASGASLQYMSFVLLVPSFGVPLYTLLHIYSLYQMASRRKGEMAEPSHVPVFSGEGRSVHP